MILSLAGEGPLGRALHARLASTGEELRVAMPSDDYLFGKACGCRTIVYVPAPSVLEGRLQPTPSTDRMRAVLGATNAPGVRLLIVAAPLGYDEEEDALRKYGCPYVILHTPPLIEEVAADPALHERCAVWLPRGRNVAVATADRVAEEIVRVMGDDSMQGATVDAPSQIMDAAEVLRQAAAPAARAAVRTVSPVVDTLVRRVGRWFGVSEPPIVGLHGRLASV
jgi:hypothetical protein